MRKKTEGRDTPIMHPLKQHHPPPPRLPKHHPRLVRPMRRRLLEQNMLPSCERPQCPFVVQRVWELASHFSFVQLRLSVLFYSEEERRTGL